MSSSMPKASPIPIETGGRNGGRLTRLDVSFEARVDKTCVTAKYHTAPVKIAKTFQYPHELAAIVMDASPGMLAGDRYEFDWKAGAGSRVYLTNQSYTKVHPCQDGNGAVLRQRFKLEEGACVQTMMEPVMLYKDADFTSETEVNLGRGASWMQIEILCPGRHLRKEAFLYRRLSSRLTVRYGGEPIFYSHQLVIPAEHRLTAPGAWEDRTHFGTFYAFSDRITSEHLETVRAALESDVGDKPQAVIAGASLTYRYGLAVSGGARTAWQLQQKLFAAWSALRLSLDGLPPFQLLKS